MTVFIEGPKLSVHLEGREVTWTFIDDETVFCLNAWALDNDILRDWSSVRSYARHP